MPTTQHKLQSLLVKVLGYGSVTATVAKRGRKKTSSSRPRFPRFFYVINRAQVYVDARMSLSQMPIVPNARMLENARKPDSWEGFALALRSLI